jgi:hypothetical protein
VVDQKRAGGNTYHHGRVESMIVVERSSVLSTFVC